MSFDPHAPLPRKTLYDIQATGVGRASSGRLWGAFSLGVAAALGAVLFSPLRWIALIPCCLAAFSLYGLAAKGTQNLDLLHDRSPGLRRTLALLRGAAAAIGVICFLAALLLAIGTALEWQWVA